MLPGSSVPANVCTVGPIDPRSVASASVGPEFGWTVSWAIVTGSEELESDVQNGFVGD